ncbi:hypothetical protein Ancab_003842 [Ancistrocladus abbreviatus]
MATSLGCGFTSRFLGTEKLPPMKSSPTAGIAGCRTKNSRAVRGTVCAVESKPTEKPLRGIMKPRRISEAMQDLVGAPEISRTQALKLIWAHIKQNNLQDPDNKRIIVCDEKLKKIFGGRERVGFLEISGLITPHFL